MVSPASLHLPGLAHPPQDALSCPAGKLCKKKEKAPINAAGKEGGFLPPPCTALVGLRRAALLHADSTDTAPKGTLRHTTTLAWVGCPGQGVWCSHPRRARRGCSILLKSEAGLTLWFSRHTAKMLK